MLHSRRKALLVNERVLLNQLTASGVLFQGDPSALQHQRTRVLGHFAPFMVKPPPIPPGNRLKGSSMCKFMEVGTLDPPLAGSPNVLMEIPTQLQG